MTNNLSFSPNLSNLSPYLPNFPHVSHLCLTVAPPSCLCKLPFLVLGTSVWTITVCVLRLVPWVCQISNLKTPNKTASPKHRQHDLLSPATRLCSPAGPSSRDHMDFSIKSNTFDTVVLRGVLPFLQCKHSLQN